jgi:hypothetical protein
VGVILPADEEAPMNGTDLIEALKSRGEWGSYFTYEGYEFVKELKSSREICIALRAWGVADASETDSALALVDKLHHALEGESRPLIARTGLPGFHL